MDGVNLRALNLLLYKVYQPRRARPRVGTGPPRHTPGGAPFLSPNSGEMNSPEFKVSHRVRNA